MSLCALSRSSARLSVLSTPISFHVRRCMMSSVAGNTPRSTAFTSSANPNVEPNYAPLSHAPANLPTTNTGKLANTFQQKSAAEYIAAVPVIEVDGPTAVCDGGDPRLGHPVQFIQLNRVRGEPETCKYCGLRFVQKHHH